MEFKFTLDDLVSSDIPASIYVLGLATASVCHRSTFNTGAISDIAKEIHTNSSVVSGMLTVRPDLFKVDGEFVELTDDAARIFKPGFHSIAPQVIEIWNNVNKEKRRVTPYKAVIDGICKADKSITLTSFESVIVHKAETWGRDEDMEKYNRPETIFKSVRRFLVYLEDARVYWQKQHKRESYF